MTRATARFKAWVTRGKLQCDDGRRLYAPRKVTCDACGCESRHFAATVADLGSDEEPRFIFTVPYEALNWGIGEEVDAMQGFTSDDFQDDQDVYLSECCEFPRMAR